MSVRTFSSPDATISVNVDEDAFKAMVEICRKSPEKETGGILVGKYLDRGTNALILEALPPPIDSVRTSSTFRRGIHGLSKELTSRWANIESHYVGEWHYHPLGNGQTSDRDIRQMIDFAKEESMQSPVPIMVIVFRPRTDQYDLNTFLFTQNDSILVLHNENKVGEG